MKNKQVANNSFIHNLFSSRRGTTLVDAMFATALLAMAGIIFAASFPTGTTCTRRARDMKIATSIAQRKIEQFRAINYESLTSALLLSAGMVDNTSTGPGYSFTSVDGVADSLSKGQGTIILTDKSTDTKSIVVTVSWREAASSRTRSVTLTTYISDKRTRAAT